MNDPAEMTEDEFRAALAEGGWSERADAFVAIATREGTPFSELLDRLRETERYFLKATLRTPEEVETFAAAAREQLARVNPSEEVQTR